MTEFLAQSRKSQHQSEGIDEDSQHLDRFGHHISTSSRLPDRITFYAIGDFGKITDEVKQTAAAMNLYAVQHGSPDFIVGLGDNFYPYGPSSASSKSFETVWRNNFVKPFPALHVPWRMVLGNHDYYGNPQAQVDYHYYERNADGLWYMPDRHYSFTVESDADETSTAESTSHVSANFFVMDTNAVETDLVHYHPYLEESLRQQRAALDDCLSSSKATWNIAFAHHPMYTAGWGHGRCGRRLRSSLPFETDFGNTMPGFDLESICIDHQLDGFYAGHEHIFQAHFHEGVDHYCCGASGADIRSGDGFYRGKEVDLSWAASVEDYGFVVVELTATAITTRFIKHDGSTIKEYTRYKSQRE